MVTPTDSCSYLKRGIAGNVSSFEKNDVESRMKSPGGKTHRLSFGTNRNITQDKGTSIGENRRTHTHANSATSRKMDQWNAKRDIPVGAVRNNPFVPEPKADESQSKFTKKRWEKPDASKVSVAARIKESNSPRKKIEPDASSKGNNSSWAEQPTSFATSSEEKQNQPPTSRSMFINGQKKGAKNGSWEPSNEIPNGTVKGRVSTLFGQGTSAGTKPIFITTKRSNAKIADEMQRQDNNADNFNSEDQWIIPERNETNTQVFGSNWGEAVVVAAKSAESDDWETPAKEWIRSGESETRPPLNGSTGIDMSETSTINTNIATESDRGAMYRDNGGSNDGKAHNFRDPIDTRGKGKYSATLRPPPKNASADQKPQMQSFANRTSRPSKTAAISTNPIVSNVFDDDFKLDPIDATTFSSAFPTHGADEMVRSSQRNADEFGFPVSAANESVTEKRNTGDVIGGDEFFDAPACISDGDPANDYDQNFEFHGLPISRRSNYMDEDVGGNTGKGETKKKRKSFFKGLFGRSKSKEKEKGELRERAKGNEKIQRELLSIRSSQSNSLTRPSETSSYDTKKHVPEDKKSSNVLSRGNYSQSAIALEDLSTPGLPVINDISDEAKISIPSSRTPKVRGEDVFDGLDCDNPTSSIAVETVKDVFVDPELDHLGMEIDSEEESNSDNNTDTPSIDLALSLGSSQYLHRNEAVPSEISPQEDETKRAATLRDTGRSRNTLNGTLQGVENGRGAEKVFIGLASSMSGPKTAHDGASQKSRSTQRSNKKSLGEEETGILDSPKSGGKSHVSLRNSAIVHTRNMPTSTIDSNVRNIPKNPISETKYTPASGRTYGTAQKDLPQTRRVFSTYTERTKYANPVRRYSRESSPIPSARQMKTPETKIQGKRYSKSTLSLTENTLTQSQQSLIEEKTQLPGNSFVPSYRYKKNSILHKGHNTQDVHQRVQNRFQTSIGSRLQNEDIDRLNINSESHELCRKSSAKFSKASHAYRTIAKKTLGEDSEDQKRYLSIPAASTSASDISCSSSTYDNYRKKLADSLRTANIVSQNSSEQSFHSHRSLDDSSIESDIRVLRSILRRPRLDHDNERVLLASRQIQGFPTYDVESATDPMQRVGLRLLSSAIIPIQTEVRRFLAMRHALTRMWALIVVQTYTRRYLARKHFQKALGSAITIQAAVRGHLARNDVIDKHICAIEIQRFVRGYLATMEVYEEIYKVTLVQSLVRMRIAMDHAAYRMSLIIQLQAVARGFLVRRQRKRLDKCATVIQSSWRCFYTRLTYQFDLLDIILIQSLWRKKLGVRAAARKVEVRRNDAATVIQAEWRKYDCRMDFLCYLSARKIQTKWRSFECRTKYVDYQASARIQSAGRMFLCRLRYIDYQASTVIQSVARMYLRRMDYVDYSSAKKIQSVARMFLCRLDYVQYQCASKIQSIGRMYLCRYDYVEYRAARAIQSIGRMYLCRSDYQEYLAAKAIQSIGRMYLCRYDYVEYRAARAIQSIGRMYLCRYDFVEYKAARVLQAAVRMLLCRSRYVEYQSASKIQSIGRMYLCRYDYVEYQAARALQALVRMYFCRSDYVEYRAATAIQAAWRRHDCRMDYVFYTSSRKIQSIGRMHVCRAKYIDYRSATRIQSMARMFSCRSRYVYNQAVRASTAIQAKWRGYIHRRDYITYTSARLIQKQWRSSICRKKFVSYIASRIIQTSWRAYVCRKIYIENFAATMIQAKWRSYDCSSMYKRYCSARVIQKTWRSYDCQMNFLHFLADILIVQSTIRRFLAQRRVKAIKNRAATIIQQRFRRYACLTSYAQTVAATAIQRTWRGFVCFADYEEFKAARNVQTAWRGYVYRRNYSKYLAARTIQAVWRGFVKYADHQEYLTVRKIQTTWRAYTHYNKYSRRKSAIKIQSAWRGKLSHRSYQRYISARKIQSAWRGLVRYVDYREFLTARKIQTVWRGFVCKRNFEHKKEAILREKAAILIQCAWRGFLVYADYMFELSDIVVVQKEIRGWLARKEATKRRSHRDNAASTMIQKNWRRWADETKLSKTTRERHASTIIQKNWRRFWCFSNFIIALDCSIQIQAQVRGYIKNKEFTSKKYAAVAIQRAWRNAYAKKLTSELSAIRSISRASCNLAKKESDAATKIQRICRGTQARTAIRLYTSVRKIQAAWRAFAPRQSFLTYIAARKIQAIWRGYIPRQGFVAYIAARCIQKNWRAFQANHDASVLRREYVAASLIQSAWRGFVCYTDYIFTLSDVVTAQRIVRGYLSRKKYSGTIKLNFVKKKNDLNGAVSIQKIYRGFQARQNYWYTLGCTMQIQSWWRGRRVCLRMRKQANALLVIQCFARCSLARQEYMQRRFVFMLIQTAESERSKKLNAIKVKEQAQEDMEERWKEKAALVIQRFFLHFREGADEFALAKKRRKKWRQHIQREKLNDDVEEALLEDVWIDLVAQSNFDEEPFTRHFTNFGLGDVGVNRSRRLRTKQKVEHNDSASLSQFKSPKITYAPHPTSSIRIIRKVDAIHMDDDFRLEEAFIDAEICHRKERRYLAGSNEKEKEWKGSCFAETQNKRTSESTLIKTKK